MDAGSSGKAMAEVVSGETMQQHVQDAVTQVVEEAVSMPKNVTDQVDSGLVGDSERTVMEPIGGGTVDKGKNIEGEEAIDYASVAGPKLSTSERDQGPKNERNNGDGTMVQLKGAEVLKPRGDKQIKDALEDARHNSNVWDTPREGTFIIRVTSRLKDLKAPLRRLRAKYGNFARRVVAL
ncbi:hypothetical protein L6452_44756 [Arctium lappa]|nr:hypothetical protein L6452_44756 [Arctium lappa]